MINRPGGTVGDLVFIAVTMAFFALAAGLVKVCDRIIGPDERSDLEVGEVDQFEDTVR
jgi:hypothetical protein